MQPLIKTGDKCILGQDFSCESGHCVSDGVHFCVSASICQPLVSLMRSFGPYWTRLAEWRNLLVLSFHFLCCTLRNFFFLDLVRARVMKNATTRLVKLFSVCIVCSFCRRCQNVTLTQNCSPRTASQLQRYVLHIVVVVVFTRRLRLQGYDSPRCNALTEFWYGANIPF